MAPLKNQLEGQFCVFCPGGFSRSVSRVVQRQTGLIASDALAAGPAKHVLQRNVLFFAVLFLRNYAEPLSLGE
jgi:hypothetical protein